MPFSMLPLPWRKVTPLHKQLGSRSLRFNYSAGATLPSAAAPQVVNLRYDISTAIDRLIGFTLAIMPGDNTQSNFILQENNTGWFFPYSYPGTIGAYITGCMETLPDEVNMQFSFSAELNAAVYVAFQNLEVVPAKLSG